MEGTSSSLRPSRSIPLRSFQWLPLVHIIIIIIVIVITFNISTTIIIIINMLLSAGDPYTGLVSRIQGMTLGQQPSYPGPPSTQVFVLMIIMLVLVMMMLIMIMMVTPMMVIMTLPMSVDGGLPHGGSRATASYLPSQVNQ